jgi:Beta propeller domain
MDYFTRSVFGRWHQLAGYFLLAAMVTFAGQSHALEPQKSLRRFSSEAEFEALLKRWRDNATKRSRAMQPADKYVNGALVQYAPLAPASPAVAAAPPPSPAASMASPVTVVESAKASLSKSKDEAESITNVQTAGVDEGGIVKSVGDYLVILRRGRLFTVRTGGSNSDSALAPVSMVDAYAPDASPSGAWYDEMLIAGNTIAVIGYSYERGGTEIGLFNIDANGGLSYRATHHLRSNDYYSSRNYASRLIGSKLIFYTPMQINGWVLDAAQFMPAQRRWYKGAGRGDFKRILPATKIYRTDDDLDPMQGVALHTVTTCDLAAAEMNCDSTAVLGPTGRVFYVSGEAVYVWTTSTGYGWQGQTSKSRNDAGTMPLSAVVRMPLNGAPPSGIKTTGSPIDQLSFLEDAGYLNVLLRSDARGDGMWAAENNQGSLALLRVKIADFGDGKGVTKSSHYQPLPGNKNRAMQNRFVGPYLIYGESVVQAVAPSNGWGRNSQTSEPEGLAYALRFANGENAQTLSLPHAVERIEALGSDVILVGARGADLQFSTVRLDAYAAMSRGATLTGKYLHSNAAQGESRTHGFFYRATSATKGILGLPTINSGGVVNRGRGGNANAAVLFLANQNLNLSPLGSLDAHATNNNDGCKASCVDWYGNARPIFMGKRVFALLGYELVEGSVQREGSGERISETRRISFAPNQKWFEKR